ncbi:MAG: hypothetical protein AAF311_01120 [Pseudomonadota bacterium]
MVQLDLFQPVPEAFWDGVPDAAIPPRVQLDRMDRAIAAAEAVFQATGHDRNRRCYRLLVALRKQRAAIRANDP